MGRRLLLLMAVNMRVTTCDTRVVTRARLTHAGMREGVIAGARALLIARARAMVSTRMSVWLRA